MNPTRNMVLGVLLNFRGAWAAMEPAMHLAPHHKPPVHPVLYLKPANTWRGAGDAIELPPEVDEVEVGATLGVVIGRAGARVAEAAALSHVAGYCIVNDVTVPQANVLRPPIRHKCRDSFCPIGAMTPAAQVRAPDALAIRVFVNGELKLENNTRNLIRGVARLIAEVSEFMTLSPGDILLVGVPENALRARVGDVVAIEIDGLGRLENRVVREPGVAT